jgi:hypothetical protein
MRPTSRVSVTTDVHELHLLIGPVREAQPDRPSDQTRSRPTSSNRLRQSHHRDPLRLDVDLQRLAAAEAREAAAKLVLPRSVGVSKSLIALARSVDEASTTVQGFLKAAGVNWKWASRYGL